MRHRRLLSNSAKSAKSPDKYIRPDLQDLQLDVAET